MPNLVNGGIAGFMVGMTSRKDEAGAGHGGLLVGVNRDRAVGTQSGVNKGRGSPRPRLGWPLGHVQMGSSRAVRCAVKRARAIDVAIRCPYSSEHHAAVLQGLNSVVVKS